MNTFTKKAGLGLAISLIAAGAHAACDTSMLAGTYRLTASGLDTTTASTAYLAQLDADGVGSFSIAAMVMSSAGVLENLGAGSGTFTLDANCQGSMEFFVGGDVEPSAIGTLSVAGSSEHPDVVVMLSVPAAGVTALGSLDAAPIISGLGGLYSEVEHAHSSLGGSSSDAQTLHQEVESEHESSEGLHSESQDDHLESESEHLAGDDMHSELDDDHLESESDHLESDEMHSELDDQHPEVESSHSENEAMEQEIESESDDSSERQSAESSYRSLFGGAAPMAPTRSAPSFWSRLFGR